MATGWEPLFRSIWIAAVASNVGTWMQNVGAVWLMIQLTPSPLMVALVLTATSLPVFLLALPAGALADVVDRRRLLVVTQLWMLGAAAVLAALAFAGTVRPWSLLVLTFLLGVGAAMNVPAWQAIIPELVPRTELPAAVALNGAGVNVARAVGPALGGAIIALAGTASVFLLNAVSFIAVVIALVRWRRVPRPTRLPREHVFGAIRAGVRYAAMRRRSARSSRAAASSSSGRARCGRCSRSSRPRGCASGRRATGCSSAASAPGPCSRPSCCRASRHTSRLTGSSRPGRSSSRSSPSGSRRSRASLRSASCC